MSRPRRQPPECTVQGCERTDVESHDMCVMHAHRHRRGLDLHVPHRDERGHVRAADLLDLADAGVSVAEALTRVGWSAEAAYRWALRHRQGDLADTVRAEYNAWKRSRRERMAAA